MAQHISSDAEMAMVLKAKYVVADFFAQWCGPCKMISPYVEQLAMQHKHVKTVKVDVDVAKDVASKYRVSSMPTFILFENGVERMRFSGADKSKVAQMYSMCKAVSFQGQGRKLNEGKTSNNTLGFNGQNSEQQKNVMQTVIAIGVIVGALFLIKFLMG